jgi:hypothetical protein
LKEKNSLDTLDSQLFDSIEYDIVNWLGGKKEQNEFVVPRDHKFVGTAIRTGASTYVVFQGPSEPWSEDTTLGWLG